MYYVWDSCNRSLRGEPSCYPSPARLPMVWGITNLDLPHELPKAALIDTARWLVRALVASSAPSGQQIPLELADWLAAHALSCSRDLYVLIMATGVLLSLLTAKTELVVRGVYGAGKTRQPTLACKDTMSTTRFGRTLPSLRWPPLCTASSLEARMTIRPLPSALPRGHKPVAPRVHPWMHEIRIGITPSGTLDLSWPPLACT